jgi:hypothetical protein
VFGTQPQNWSWVTNVLPKVLVVSNVFWLVVGLMFTRRRLRLAWALELGAASPFLGAIVLGILFPTGFTQLPIASPGVFQSIMVYLTGVASRFWICMPLGMATAYLVQMVQAREVRPA